MAKTPGYWDETKYVPLIPKGNKDTFGRVKVSDTITDTDESNSCAASPKAVLDAIDSAVTNIEQKGYLTATNFSSGDNNGTIKVDSTNIKVKGLGSAAYKETTDFLASDSIATGDSDGTIKVGSTNIEVKGLGSAAYKETTDFAPNSTTTMLNALLGTGSLGSSTKPIYLSGKELKECNDYPSYKADGTNILLDNSTNTFSLNSTITNNFHEKNSASTQTGTINIGGDSAPQVVTGLEYTDYGHVSKIMKDNVVLNAPVGNSLGGVKSGGYINVDTSGIISHSSKSPFLLHGENFSQIQKGAAKELLCIKEPNNESDVRRVISLYNRDGVLNTTLGHGSYPLRLSSDRTITTNQVFETTSATFKQKSLTNDSGLYYSVNLGSLGSSGSQQTEKLIPFETVRSTGLDVFSPYYDYSQNSYNNISSRGIKVKRAGTILISGRIFFRELKTDAAKRITGKIRKASSGATDMGTTQLLGVNTLFLPASADRVHLVFSPFSISVKEGDLIGVSAEIDSGKQAMIGANNSDYNAYTSLFIQFLD